MTNKLQVSAWVNLRVSELQHMLVPMNPQISHFTGLVHRLSMVVVALAKAGDERELHEPRGSGGTDEQVSAQRQQRQRGGHTDMSSVLSMLSSSSQMDEVAGRTSETEGGGGQQ